MKINKLSVAVLMVVALSGCGDEDTSSPVPPPTPTPSPVTPLHPSDFIFSPTIGGHATGNFTRLRFAGAADHEYADIAVETDYSGEKPLVSMQISYHYEGGMKPVTSTYIKIAGNPEIRNDVKGLYTGETLNFIFECGEGAELIPRISEDSGLEYHAFIESHVINERTCEISYFDAKPEGSRNIYLDIKDGYVTRLEDRNTDMVFDEIDINYVPPGSSK